MTDDDIASRLNAVTEDSMYNEPWTTNQLCFEAAKEIQKLRSLLDGRDSFLVEKGLFGEFVDLQKAQRGQGNNPT